MPIAKPIINGKRECTKCGFIKPISEFGKESRSLMGISPYCKECGRSHYRSYRQDNLKAHRQREAKWRNNNRQRIKNWHKENRKKQKREIINYYGGKCECCGETKIEFLAIDHIEGKGNQHRKQIGNGNLLYWIIRNNFPKGFRILCHNCNMSLGLYGYCPHQKK